MLCFSHKNVFISETMLYMVHQTNLIIEIIELNRSLFVSMWELRISYHAMGNADFWAGKLAEDAAILCLLDGHVF